MKLKITIFCVIASVLILFPSNTFAMVRADSIINVTLQEIDKRLIPLEDEIKQLRIENQELRKEIEENRQGVISIREIVMTFQRQIIEIQKMMLSFIRAFSGNY